MFHRNISKNQKDARRVEVSAYYDECTKQEWDMYIDSDYQCWTYQGAYYYSIGGSYLIYCGESIEDFFDFINA